VITDGNMKPVLIESIFGATDDGTNIEGMRAGGIEISVVSDFGRQMIYDILNFVQYFSL